MNTTNNKKICKVEGCGNKIHAHGFCSKHYQRQYKYDRLFKIKRTESKIIIKEDYALVELTRGFFAKIDIEDIDKVRGRSWSLANVGYAVSNKKWMHRAIIEVPKNKYVDHINHNKIDNRKYNLRICTKSQNGMNKKPQRGCSSKYKGVIWNKINKNWIARIKLNKKSKHLGSFKSEEQAALAYNKKAKELFGEFAYLNTIN